MGGCNDPGAFYLKMMREDYAKFLETAVAAAREAGKLALGMQGALKDIRFKGEKDLVTEADYLCDDTIRGILAAAHPDHNIITEEAAGISRGSEYTWFVDPIDGTVNYSRGFPLWGVSVGLQRSGSPVAGAIFLPALGEMFTATLGGGAFLNGKPIRTSAVSELNRAIISHGDFNVGTTEEERRLVNEKTLMARSRSAASLQRVKCLGSAVLECAFVAAGRMEAYCMLSMKPWDVAVGGLLVAEAGGKATRLDGGPFAIEGQDALFSNGLLHAQVLAVLRPEFGA
jgi:myo-inositol-1(or 4)-monophosphatase